MDQLTELAKAVSDALDADVLLMNSEIREDCVDAAILSLRGRGIKRDNVALILTTYGGDPDAAYRLTRFLKRSFKKFTLIVYGYCKSAGTLVALGADEIVMSAFAELGPLDIQLLREDEMTSTSGLSYFQALLVLRDQSYQFWESHFLQIKDQSQGGISTKTAADISTALTVGILQPIAAQIDPLRLGEVERASAIALEYGRRLCKNDSATQKLALSYPSHGFVIDFEEAQSIFDCVREPSNVEAELEQFLFQRVRKPRSDGQPIVRCLYPIDTEDEKENTNDTQNRPDKGIEQGEGKSDQGDSAGAEQDVRATSSAPSEQESDDAQTQEN